MQLKKIKVYGKLRQFLGKSYFEAAVKSPQQAMNFLMANFEGLQKHMNDQVYRVKMGKNVITEDYLSISGQGDIQIIPIASGSKFLIPFVVGGGLIAAGAAAAAASSFIIGTLLSTALTTIGTSMIIGGITDLISPQNSPQNISSVSDIDPAIRGSYSFSGIQNVSSSGVPVPIIYGHVFSGSIIISAGTDTAQITKGVTQGDGTTDTTTATATATGANVSSGALTGSLTIDDGGAGYSRVPSISITGGGGDSSSVFITPTITDGAITSVELAGGTGYTSPPTITIEEPTGPSDDMTYTQSGNIITVTANGHTFTNGENVDVDFITGPLADHPSIDPCTIGVQDVTENQFRASLGQWSNQTYSNSGNIVTVTRRNKPT